MEKSEVIDLIADTGFGTLATTEGDQPRVRPMRPLLYEDKQLIVALLSTSRTIDQVKINLTV